MDRLEETLFNTSLRTFEELAFFMPVPEENPDTVESKQVMTCVDYQGFSEGSLYISVTEGLLPVLAQNILAEDDIPAEQQLDALKEIANVICGNLLPTLAGGDKKYRLKTPEIVTAINPVFQGDDFDFKECVFYFYEGTVKLSWYYNKTKIS